MFILIDLEGELKVVEILGISEDRDKIISLKEAKEEEKEQEFLLEKERLKYMEDQELPF